VKLMLVRGPLEALWLPRVLGTLYYAHWTTVLVLVLLARSGMGGGAPYVGEDEVRVVGEQVEQEVSASVTEYFMVAVVLTKGCRKSDFQVEPDQSDSETQSDDGISVESLLPRRRISLHRARFLIRILDLIPDHFENNMFGKRKWNIFFRPKFERKGNLNCVLSFGRRKKHHYYNPMPSAVGAAFLYMSTFGLIRLDPRYPEIQENFVKKTSGGFEGDGKELGALIRPFRLDQGKAEAASQHEQDDTLNRRLRRIDRTGRDASDTPWAYGMYQHPVCLAHRWLAFAMPYLFWPLRIFWYIVVSGKNDSTNGFMYLVNDSFFVLLSSFFIIIMPRDFERLFSRAGMPEAWESRRVQRHFEVFARVLASSIHSSICFFCRMKEDTTSTDKSKETNAHRADCLFAANGSCTVTGPVSHELHHDDPASPSILVDQSTTKDLQPPAPTYHLDSQPCRRSVGDLPLAHLPGEATAPSQRPQPENEKSPTTRPQLSGSADVQSRRACLLRRLLRHSYYCWAHIHGDSFCDMYHGHGREVQNGENGTLFSDDARPCWCNMCALSEKYMYGGTLEYRVGTSQLMDIVTDNRIGAWFGLASVFSWVLWSVFIWRGERTERPDFWWVDWLG